MRKLKLTLRIIMVIVLVIVFFPFVVNEIRKM